MPVLDKLHKIFRKKKKMEARELLVKHARSLNRVLMYGPPGTGKSHLALLAGQPGDNAWRVIMTEETPAAELRGHWVPKGSGEWIWHDGPVMRAYRHGGRLVIDEISRAHDDAWSFLLAVLDGHPITLPNGETVRPHPELSVWATTNESADVLPDALNDRFPVKVYMPKPSQEALATLDNSRLAQAVYNGDVTFRQAAEFVRLSDIMGSENAALLVWEARANDVLYGLRLAAHAA